MHRFIPVCLLVLLGLMRFGVVPLAQPVFRGDEIFPPEEFAARRAKVIDRIGDGVAVVLGTPEPPGEMPFRQNSQFFYLTGVAEPRASVDHRRPHEDRRRSFCRPRTSGATRACTARRSRRVPRRPQGGSASTRRCRPRTSRAAIAALAAEDRRTIYTPFAAEVLGSQSQGDPTRLWTANRQDPWDGRDSREATVHRQAESAAAPTRRSRISIRSSNALRAVKSPREIAVIREATRIAGLGIMEAMRDARPGMHEYELQADAEFVFKKYGALGAVVLRADRDRAEHLLHALQPQHRDAGRRRSGAVRLRARLQVLPVGRHARVSGERQVHAAPARDVRDLPAALSGAADVDRGAHDGRPR